jgi:hypothetical protein
LKHFRCKIHRGQAIGQKFNAGVFPSLFQTLEDLPWARVAVTPHRYHQALEFVIDDFAEKCTVSRIDSKAEKYRLWRGSCPLSVRELQDWARQESLFSPRSEPKEQP